MRACKMEAPFLQGGEDVICNQTLFTCMNRFYKFIMVGVINTILDISIFVTLIYFFGTQNVILFNIFSYSVGIICSFFLNGKFTFNDKNLFITKFIKLYLSSSFGMLINTLIIFITITLFGMNVILSKIIATIIVVMYNYFICKNYIFENSS